MLARPFLKMLAIKLNLSAEMREQISENPFALLSNSDVLTSALSLRCADCTVKKNASVA